MISDSWMQELMNKTDIASLIGEYTTLTPKGGKLWGCCPFHNEKTPSFKVDTSTQLYYCFGCHKGGNAITFLKEKENLSGFDAVKTLAERAGMQLPESGFDSEAAERNKRERQRLQNANRDAARFYYENIKTAGAALSYLHGRELSDEVITRFGLGFAPDKWTALCDHMKSKGYTEEELLSAGLAKKSGRGGVIDVFRNRIMFPIIDEKGNVLAFGGRTMGDDKSKYLNTGDTPIYSKRNNVYALNMLKKGTHSDIIIVEGYMDVISLHSVGVCNAVATLGTALTENQARLIKRRTSLVYVSYDGDSAGQNATMRGLDILASEVPQVRVIKLPDGLDPDDYAKKYGKDGYMKLKDESLALNTFKLEHMAQKYDMSTQDARQEYAIEACKLIAALQPVEQERYYEYVSKKTGLSYETLMAQGASVPVVPEKRNTFAQIRKNKEKAPTFAKTDRERVELTMLSCAVSSADAAYYLAENAQRFITRDDIYAFIKTVAREYREKGKCDVAVVMGTMGTDIPDVAAAVFEHETQEPLKVAKDCVRRLEIREVEDELMELSGKLDIHEITAEEYKKSYAELILRLRTLKG